MKIFARITQTLLIYTLSIVLTLSLPLSAMAEGEIDTTQVATSTVPTCHQITDNWCYDSATDRYQRVVQPIEAEQPTTDTAQPTVAEQPTTVATQPTVAEQPVIISPTDTPTTLSSQTENNSVPTVISTNNVNQTAASNTIDSQALTGDATVKYNTTAGNATTGNAIDTATVLNNVNSVLSIADNQKAATFVTDVMGDVNGDIMLQPMLLKSILESGVTSPSSTKATVINDSTLTNNINLGSTSGNAGVIGNTKAGNATSGTANTVANVVNIINSMVAANQSFIGTVNIYGNLNGDILIAPDFIPQLIASNGGETDSEQTAPTVSIIDSKDMQSIVNNVSLAAESGKAAVMDNTTAGNATTGDASTNVVIFNLSGHEVIASNSLLVFVNVLGKWVGVIVDAPVGATAAAIGNGVTTDKTVLPDLTLVSDNKSLITNNISLASKSGNATVAANTIAGNATSGDATASANIVNMTGSQFGLSGWFGILFINVFGSWHGSFGIDTVYGNPVTESTGPQAPTGVIEFIPSTPSQESSNITFVSMNSDGNYSVTNSQSQSDNAKILGSTSPTDKGSGTSPVSRLSSNGVNMALLAGSTFLIIISAAGINRLRFTRQAVM